MRTKESVFYTKVFLSCKYLHLKFYLTFEKYSFMLPNLIYIVFSFTSINNCGTFGVRQVTEKNGNKLEKSTSVYGLQESL
jgi:hypothetical protein